jgi:ABC-type sugar transport system permease subunit
MLLITVATVTAFFPWIYPLTHGGPGIASTTLDFNIWATGIRDGQFGRASAIAVVSLVFIALLLGGQLLFRHLRERRDA